MRFQKLVIGLLFIGTFKVGFSQNVDSVRTIVSIEMARFNSKSDYVFDLKHYSSKLIWQSVGIRVHQELNSAFQINTGVVLQSTTASQLPIFTRSYTPDRTFYSYNVNFITVPLGVKTSVNLYKRKLFTGLSFAYDLNFYAGKQKELAADFSNFSSVPYKAYKEMSIFIHKSFYGSQELGFFVNYFLNDKFKILLSVNAIIENDDPVIVASPSGQLGYDKMVIFNGNGMKLRFQLGYSIFKTKAFIFNEPKEEEPSQDSTFSRPPMPF